MATGWYHPTIFNARRFLINKYRSDCNLNNDVRLRHLLIEAFEKEFCCKFEFNELTSEYEYNFKDPNHETAFLLKWS